MLLTFHPAFYCIKHNCKHAPVGCKYYCRIETVSAHLSLLLKIMLIVFAYIVVEKGYGDQKRNIARFEIIKYFK